MKSLLEADPQAVYRGLSSYRYRCITSLERALVEGVDEGDKPTREMLEQAAVTNFRALAGSRLSQRPDDDDLLAWLCLMQHYSAPTRLLDWTESPFVACYFAYSSMRSDQTEPAAL